MKTRDLIVEPCALIDLVAQDPAAAILEMLAAMEAAGRLKDPARCLADVQARQRQHRGGIGGGIAIPHACTTGVCQPLLAVGRRRSGLDFQAADNQPAKLIFLLLAPKAAAGLHLKILARLAHIAKTKDAGEFLMNAQSPAESLAFFEKCGQELGEICSNPTARSHPHTCRQTFARRAAPCPPKSTARTRKRSCAWIGP